MARQEKTQTNLKLSRPRAAALDIESALEGKDKAEIVEEALQLRDALMGPEYQAAVESALAVRFKAEPHATEELDEDIDSTTPGGAFSLSDLMEEIQARRGDGAFRARLEASMARNRRILDRLAQ